MVEFKMVGRSIRTALDIIKEWFKWHFLALIVAREEYYKEKMEIKKMVDEKKPVRYFKLVAIEEVPILKMFEKINKVTVKEIERDTIDIFGGESKLVQEFVTKFCLTLMDVRNMHWSVVEDIVEVLFRNGKYKPQYSLAIMDALSNKTTFMIEYDPNDRSYWLVEKRNVCGEDVCPCESEDSCRMNAFADAILSRDQKTMPRA